MKRLVRMLRCTEIRVACVVSSSVLVATGALAQTPGGTLAATQPASLPLSSRNGEAGRVVATQSIASGSTAGTNTLMASIQAQGPIAGSTLGTVDGPFSGLLSLHDAIQRALDFNLSAVGFAHAIRQSRGQQVIARSALLPNVIGDFRDVEQQLNLQAQGVRFDVSIPGVSVPAVVGPFNVVDLRARLSQTLFDRTALNNYRAARETVHATELTARDSRDLIVLAVAGSYLQATAARARAEAAQAQIDTATTLRQRTVQQRGAGLATPIDVNRSEVQLLIQQQRLASLQADFAKQKINLARMTGLPPTDQYELADNVAFAAAPELTLEDALRQARQHRSDLQAADAHVQAAERALAAAQAQALPSVAVLADYGANRAGTYPFHQTFSIVAAVRVPIWEGGRADGEVQQARAVVGQRVAELEDLKAEIEADIRRAYVDLQAAARQIEVADANVRLSTETLALTRQRFEAGVSDNLSVVQSQESVAVAELDRINSIFAHNLAKLTLARAMGRADEDLTQFLRVP
jgi:outer membrane protein TolC